MKIELLRKWQLELVPMSGSNTGKWWQCNAVGIVQHVREVIASFYTHSSDDGITKTRPHFYGSLVVAPDKNLMRQRLYSGTVKWFFSLKSAGTRYQLLLTVYEGIRLALWYNRGQQVFLLPSFFSRAVIPDSFFSKHSLFDGELIVNNTKDWEFQIFNCVWLCGESCVTMPYLRRLQMAQNAVLSWQARAGDMKSWNNTKVEKIRSCEIRNVFRLAQSCIVGLWVKPVFHLWEYPTRFLPTIMKRWDQEFASDGLVLTANEIAEATGESLGTLKYKAARLTTIDVEVHWIPSGYPEYLKVAASLQLVVAPSEYVVKHYAKNPSLPVCVMGTYVVTETESRPVKYSVCVWPNDDKRMEASVAQTKQKTCIVEMEWDEPCKCWRWVMVRERSSANSLSTIQKLVQLIKDPLTDDDVFPFLKDMSAVKKQFRVDSFIGGKNRTSQICHFEKGEQIKSLHKDETASFDPVPLDILRMLLARHARTKQKRPEFWPPVQPNTVVNSFSLEGL